VRKSHSDHTLDLVTHNATEGSLDGSRKRTMFSGPSPTRPARALRAAARDGEQTVHALTDRAGVSQPAVSKHLTVLEEGKDGAAFAARDAKTHYSAQPQPWRRWLTGWPSTAHFWRERFGRLNPC